ncbi:MAG: hypothetical protein LUG85_07425 [Clostridiales bacterium]|nr:hypothetical protein [Clostridiales bacterium]
MSVKQISVFIENKPGKLAEVTRFIAEKNINLKALSIADTQDFGILRIICGDADAAVSAIKDGGYVATVTDVLAVEIEDKPGSLAEILEYLAKAEVVVEYTYAFLSVKNNESAYMIFRVDDSAKAEKALTEANVKVADADMVFG